MFSLVTNTMMFSGIVSFVFWHVVNRSDTKIALKIIVVLGAILGILGLIFAGLTTVTNGF